MVWSKKWSFYLNKFNRIILLKVFWVFTSIFLFRSSSCCFIAWAVLEYSSREIWMVLQWLKPKTQPLSQATTDDKILFNVLCLSLYRVIHKSVNHLIDCSMKWELYYNLWSKRSTDSIWTFAIFVSPWTSFEPLMSQAKYLYRFTALIFFKF